MAYDDILKALASYIKFLQILKKGISTDSNPDYLNVVNVSIKLREVIRSLVKRLDKQDDKAIRRLSNNVKASIEKLQDSASDSISRSTSPIKVTNHLVNLIGDLNELSELLAARIPEFLLNEFKDALGNVNADLDKLPAGKGQDDEQYIPCIDALTFAKTKNRKISSSKLSKILVENGPMRYKQVLSKGGKPYRKNVHFGDFKEYIKTLPKIKPDGNDITDEAIDDFLGDGKDEYSVIHEEKMAKHKESNPKNEPYQRLAKKISGLDA